MGCVFTAMYISKCCRGDFCYQAKRMYETGICPKLWVRVFEIECMKRLISLFVISYAVPFAARTPFQLYSGVFTIFLSLLVLAATISDGLDLLRVNRPMPKRRKTS